MDHSFVTSLVWPPQHTPNQIPTFQDPQIWEQQQEEREGHLLNSLAVGGETADLSAPLSSPHPSAVVSDLKNIQRLQAKLSPAEEERQG